MLRLLGSCKNYANLVPSGIRRIEIKCYCSTKDISMSRTSDTLEKKLREKDGVPADFSLVYRAVMNNWMHFSYVSSSLLLIVGGLNVYSLVTSDTPIVFPIEGPMKRTAPLTNYFELSIMYLAFFAMTYIPRSISLKYAMRIYYNERTRTYKAITVGFIPGAIRHHDFPAKSLKRLVKRSLVPWWNIQYNANGKNLMIFDTGFKTGADYDRMFEDKDNSQDREK